MKPTTKLVLMSLEDVVRRDQAAGLNRPVCSDERINAAARQAEFDFVPPVLSERQRPIPTGEDATYVDLECLADIAVEPLESVWGSVVTRGCVTVLAGEPGIGKSFVALDIAAAVTRGATGPTSQPQAEQRANDSQFLNPSCDAGDGRPAQTRERPS